MVNGLWIEEKIHVNFEVVCGYFEGMFLRE